MHIGNSCNNNLTELLQCCIGAVNIKVDCQSSLIDGLANAKSRMAEFPLSRPVDLKLSIVLATQHTRKSRQGQSGGSAASDSLLRLLPRRGAGSPLGVWMVPRLEQLSYDPLLNDLHDELSPGRMSISLVPFEAGFMFADMKGRSALLILDRPFRPPLTTDQISWWASADITVLNAIMALLAFHLADRGGVIAHGVGVRRGEEGYLFMAPSRGGKSTLAAQSPPGAVLSDDGVILRETGEGYRLYPTPFRQRPGGEIMSWNWHAKPVPVRALFILGHGREVRVTPIPRPKLLGLLVGSYTHFNLWMDKQRAGLVFDFWRRISLKLRIARLDWRPGTDFWPAVEKFLAREGISHAFKEGHKHLAQGI